MGLTCLQGDARTPDDYGNAYLPGQNASSASDSASRSRSYDQSLNRFSAFVIFQTVPPRSFSGREPWAIRSRSS